MLPPSPDLAELRRARERFMEMAAEVRPDLHRYCTRMTGSVVDGEDLVQDTLARAYFMLPELLDVPAMRPWLFRVAHHRAIDFMRRYERKNAAPLDDDGPYVAVERDPADELLQREAVTAALARFIALPPLPRSAVILKDVLGCSLDEIGSLLELSLPAVKAAVHRGRTRLHETAESEPAPAPAPSPQLARYVALFNARDWDGFRATLSDEVRCEVVARARRQGAREVGQYVSNYAAVDGWFFRVGALEGREVVLVFDGPDAAAPRYFIEVLFDGDRVMKIRDYRYVPYIATDAAFTVALPS